MSDEQSHRQQINSGDDNKLTLEMSDEQSHRQQINSGDAFSIMLLFKECGAF